MGYRGDDMRQNVLDVLIYLFETYSDEQTLQAPERHDLEVELTRAGFYENEIERALSWIDDLSIQWSFSEKPQKSQAALEPSTRIFNADEQHRIPSHCRGYIYYLEQIGILNQLQRERVIDRTLALETSELDIESLQWVVLMVLFSQPDQEKALLHMENLIQNENSALIH